MGGNAALPCLLAVRAVCESLVQSRGVGGLRTGCDLIQIDLKEEEIFYLFGIS